MGGGVVGFNFVCFVYFVVNDLLFAPGSYSRLLV